jgi:hypothetical protein
LPRIRERLADSLLCTAASRCAGLRWTAQEFYATVAQASFTLLGLWWVLLQIRYEAWFANVDYRRAVYDISLYFLLPGMMGLGALLAAQEPAIWRGVFAVLGTVGVVESALVVGGMRVLRAWPALVAVADWASLLAYALLTTTQVIVELAPGVRLVALEQNTYRARSDDRWELGSRVRLGWRPEHGLVLRQG